MWNKEIIKIVVNDGAIPILRNTMQASLWTHPSPCSRPQKYRRTLSPLLGLLRDHIIKKTILNEKYLYYEFWMQQTPLKKAHR